MVEQGAANRAAALFRLDGGARVWTAFLGGAETMLERAVAGRQVPEVSAPVPAVRDHHGDDRQVLEPRPLRPRPSGAEPLVRVDLALSLFVGGPHAFRDGGEMLVDHRVDDLCPPGLQAAAFEGVTDAAQAVRE